MKLLLACFATITLISSSAYAGPAFVQVSFDEGYPVTSQTVTFRNPVQAGSLLVLAMRLSTDGGATSVTSTGGRTWTRDHRQLSFLGLAFEVWSLPNAPAGTTTVTSQISGSATSVRMFVAEYSGIAATSPRLTSTSATAPASGTVDTGPVTTTVDNNLVFVAVATDSDLMGWTAGSGFTLRPAYRPTGLPSDKVIVEDRVALTAGTLRGTMTIKPDTWAAILVVYRASGGSTLSPPAAASNVRIIR
jgi:hypothetical protein